MPQTWQRQSLTFTLRQSVLLIAIAYFLSAARSYAANESESHLVSGSASGQTGDFRDKQVSVARAGTQTQPEGLTDFTAKQASLLKQCASPPVCHKPSLLDASASDNLCPVDGQVPVGPADLSLSGKHCFVLPYNMIPQLLPINTILSGFSWVDVTVTTHDLFTRILA